MIRKTEVRSTGARVSGREDCIGQCEAAVAAAALISGSVIACAVPPAAGATGSAGPARCQSNQVAAAPQVCVAKGDPRGAEVLATIRALQAKYSQKAVIFGVWDGRKVVISGALGTSYPGVPATRAMHFRMGNVTESMQTTLLLQLVVGGPGKDPVG